MAVDLLRPALRQSRPAVTATRVALIVNVALSLAVLALVLAIGAQWWLQARVRAEYDAKVAAVAPQWNTTRARLQQIRQLRRDVAALRSEFDAPEWIDVFEAVRAAVPPGLWLSRVTATDTGGVEITVRTAQAQATAAFIRRLQATPGLTDVRLLLTETVRVEGAAISQATVAARVLRP